MSYYFCALCSVLCASCGSPFFWLVRLIKINSFSVLRFKIAYFLIVDFPTKQKLTLQLTALTNFKLAQQVNN